MLREFWLMVFLGVTTACGQAEFATTTDTAPTPDPAAAPIPASEDSTAKPGSEAGWDEMDFPDEVELDDDGDGDECVDDVKRSKDCYMTSDFRVVCEEVVSTSVRQ